MMWKRLSRPAGAFQVVSLAVILLACGSGAGSSSAPEPTVTGTCEIPPRTYKDLAACRGASKQVELEIADSYDGKSVGRIAVASRDPQAILAAMGAFTSEWSIGSDSWTLHAYGAVNDYGDGAGYNRGRIHWNDDGPITVDICTEITEIDGLDFCEEQATYTVSNR